jgi:hypothetical protein
MEDFWFVKDQQGKGTEVTTLQSGQNLGEIADVEFFVKKLYKAMRVPWSRYTGEGVQAQGTQMSKDDIKFEAFVYAMVRKFSDVVKQVFRQHLRAKGLWNYYEMKDADFDIVPVPPSYFQYMKNNELLEAQFTRFAAYANNLNTEKPVFSKKMALIDGLGWTEEKYNQNKKWLVDEEQESAEATTETLPDEAGGGGGAGAGEAPTGGDEIEAPDIETPDSGGEADEIKI